MSISSFCIEQREKEKAALKSLLTYSVAGSAALHLGLAFGIALIWPKQPSLADDPIELIVIDAPEPEVIKPPEKAPEPLPTPKPQPVVTPPPQKPVATITPEPVFTPPPLKEVEPPKPLMPEPLPQPMEKPVATITPEPIPTPAPSKEVEPPKPLMPESQPQPTEEVKKLPLREPLPPPKVSEPIANDNPPIREKPLQTPSVNSQPFQNSFAQTRPTQTANEETPNLPGGLTANQQPPSNNSTATSQPLQSSAPDNRTFRDNFTTANNTPLGGNPTDDNSLTTPGIPGDVATSREAAPNQPMVTSKPLQSSSNSANREFRDSFSSASNAGPDVLSGDTSSSIPGVPGGVTANRQPTSRPLANSQPLSGSGSGSANRGFRDSFSNSNSGTGSSGSNPDSDFSGGIPGGTSQGVAANQGAPPKPGGSGQGTQGTGRGRRVARRGSASGVRCIRECQPQYPSHLEDAEGRPEVRFTIESDGSTTDPELAQTSGNSDLDQAAVEAVRKMQFAPPADGPVSVRIGINFVASGSRFERQARERREENDRQRRERERQQQQLESIEPENSTSN